MVDETANSVESLFEQARSISDIAGEDNDVHIVELLSVYVSLKPDRGMAWFYLGDAFRTVGRMKDAEDALTKALELAPKSHRFTVYARIAMLKQKHVGPAEAEKWYRLATAEPNCPAWMWCARGANLKSTESYRLAKSCLENALSGEDVDKEEAYLNLALIARAERRYEDARAYLKKALEIDPQYSDAKLVLQSLEGIEKTIEKVAEIARMSAHA